MFDNFVKVKQLYLHHVNFKSFLKVSSKAYKILSGQCQKDLSSSYATCISLENKQITLFETLRTNRCHFLEPTLLPKVTYTWLYPQYTSNSCFLLTFYVKLQTSLMLFVSWRFLTLTASFSSFLILTDLRQICVSYISVLF